MSDFWQNDQPFMVLSADCLDGHFAWPGVPSVGEVILKLDGRGSVAHWGSSGLGLTSEHSVLHKGFYDGMFDVGFTAVGDAVNYAKLVYENGNNHHSELYSFNLQGDPAMQLFRPDLDVRKRAVQNEVDPGDPVDFRIDIRNDGLYPAHVVVTDTLPSDLTFVGAVASAPVISSTVGGNQIRFEFLTEFNLGETFAITVTANTMTDFIGTTTNWVTAVSTGLDINPNNNTTSALITSTVPSVIVTNYAATPLNNEVQLDWETSQELNILSYKVERAVQGGSFVWLNQLGVDGYIPAQGNPGGFTYQEFDTTAHNGVTYLYRLKAIQENQSEFALGTRTVTLSPQAQLTDFNATPLDSKVPLDWTAVSEYDLDAYHIERGQDGTFTWLQDLGQGGYINATGGLTLTASYLVTDTTAVNGQTYTYRLMAHQALTPGANIAIVATRTVTLMDLMLVQFDAEAVGYDAQLTWQTQSEINVGAFRIERGQNGNFVWLQTLGDNGYIPATGGAITADYLVTDTTAAAGKTYTYRLIAVQAEPGGYETNLAEDTVRLQYLTFLPFLGRP
jgi:uncharacterized repeat protein (TIGR01451 family)